MDTTLTQEHSVCTLVKCNMPAQCPEHAPLPTGFLLNGAAKLFHVEKLGSPKSRHQSGGTLRELGASMTEAAMSRWTDEELRELITLWPTHSVAQIVKRLHRPRWAIRSKAKRLRLDGLSPHNPSEDVQADNPPKRRPPQSKMPRSPRADP